jgi:hypothetical protein
MIITLDIARNPDVYYNIDPSCGKSMSEITAMLVVFVTAMTGCQTVNNLTVSSNRTVVLHADGSDRQNPVLDRIN